MLNGPSAFEESVRLGLAGVLLEGEAEVQEATKEGDECQHNYYR